MSLVLRGKAFINILYLLIIIYSHFPTAVKLTVKLFMTLPAQWYKGGGYGAATWASSLPKTFQSHAANNLGHSFKSQLGRKGIKMPSSHHRLGSAAV